MIFWDEKPKNLGRKKRYDMVIVFMVLILLIALFLVIPMLPLETTLILLFTLIFVGLRLPYELA